MSGIFATVSRDQTKNTYDIESKTFSKEKVEENIKNNRFQFGICYVHRDLFKQN